MPGDGFGWVDPQRVKDGRDQVDRVVES
jgi:hypothetical protein